MSLLYKTVMQSQGFTFSCFSFETQDKQSCLHWKTSVYTFSRSSWSLCSLDSKHAVILLNQWVMYGHIFERLKTKSEALLHIITSVPSFLLHIIYWRCHPIMIIWSQSKPLLVILIVKNTTVFSNHLVLYHPLFCLWGSSTMQKVYELLWTVTAHIII